jgi:hypothetical protein
MRQLHEALQASVIGCYVSGLRTIARNNGRFVDRVFSVFDITASANAQRAPVQQASLKR